MSGLIGLHSLPCGIHRPVGGVEIGRILPLVGEECDWLAVRVTAGVELGGWPGTTCDELGDSTGPPCKELNESPLLPDGALGPDFVLDTYPDGPGVRNVW